MFTTLIVFQVLLAIGLIAIVLVQRGPGATMGAAFGAGASGTVFGSRGAGNFLTRTTGWLAVGFFGVSLTLAVLATSISRDVDTDSPLAGSVLDEEQQSAEQESAPGIDAVIDSLDEQAPAGAAAPQAGEPAADGPADGDAAASGGAAEGEGASEEDNDELPEPPPLG